MKENHQDSGSPPAAASLNPERQEKAREYARIQRRFLLVDLGLGFLVLLLWLFLGWSTALRDWIYSWTSNPWIAVAVFGLCFGSTFFILDLPLSYYTGFVLPHRYQQSNQSLSGWISDQLKSVLLSVILGGLILEMIFFVLRTAPDTWWLWAGAFLFVFNIILANLAPVIIMPIFNKFTPLDEEYQELQSRLIQLAEKAGTSVKGVYQFDLSRRTKSANAALTGLGETRRIILGDTLLEEFSADEIETVLAHELGHHANQDIPLSIAFQTGLTFAGLGIASLVLSWGVNVFRFQGPADPAALPLIGLVLGIYGLLTMAPGNAFSRWRERKADQYALQLTGKGDAYASALIRLANQNLAEADPEPWVEFLLYSHPALKKRIQKAEGIGNQVDI